MSVNQIKFALQKVNDKKAKFFKLINKYTLHA